MSDQNEKSALLIAIKRLEARREALKVAIDELMILADQPVDDATPQGTIEPTVNTHSSGGHATIRSDTFFGMNAPSAAKKYLEMVKRPAPTREIANAMEKGGFLSHSKNLTASVHTALTRDSAAVRVTGKWGLAEWYPAQVKPKRGRHERDNSTNGRNERGNDGNEED
ncbi:MAG: hypothetical protein V3T31_01685 [candidate division Zixibacteria bacterium]